MEKSLGLALLDEPFGTIELLKEANGWPYLTPNAQVLLSELLSAIAKRQQN